MQSLARCLRPTWDTEDSDDSAKTLLFALLVTVAIACLIGGILTTTLIIRCTARNVSQDQMVRARSLKSVYDQEQELRYGNKRWA